MADPSIPPDTLIVDGHDISLLTGCSLPPGALLGVFAPGNRRGASITAAGVQGQRGAVSRPLDKFAFAIPVHIFATTGTDGRTLTASTLANYIALIAAVGGLATSGNVLLCRRLSTSGSHVDQYARGEFSAAQSLTWLDAYETLSVELQFTNLSAAWTPTLGDVDDPNASTWVIP